MKKKTAMIILLGMNIACLAGVAYLGIGYVSVSNSTHQSFLSALERARLAGATDSIPQLNSDYIDHLREQIVYQLIATAGLCIVLVGNTAWIFLHRKQPIT
jgi:hypothetical protein